MTVYGRRHLDGHVTRLASAAILLLLVGFAVGALLRSTVQGEEEAAVDGAAVTEALLHTEEIESSMVAANHASSGSPHGAPKNAVSWSCDRAVVSAQTKLKNGRSFAILNGARQWRARKGGYLRWPLEAHNYTRRKSTDGITASTASFLFVFAGFLPQRARGRHIGLQSLAKKGAGVIGGSKLQQHSRKQTTAQMHGCNFNDLGISPATYATWDKTDCSALKLRLAKDAADGKPRAWIKKAAMGFHGAGLKVFLPGNETLTAELVDTYCKTGGSVIQRYLDRPLLLNRGHPRGGFKFDFRMWLLVARADPWIVYGRDGHVRRAAAPFADGGRLAHITNARETDRLKGKVEGFSRHHKYWSLQDVQRYLDKHHAGEAPAHFVDRQLRPFVKQVMRYLFESVDRSQKHC